MPIQKSRDSSNSVFVKPGANLLGVLFTASAILFLASNMSKADAAATNNWACTKNVNGAGRGYSESLAIKDAWRRWRQTATARCGAKCALPKNAGNKQVWSEPRPAGGYAARVKASACYHLPSIGNTKSPGVGLRAPTKLP